MGSGLQISAPLCRPDLPVEELRGLVLPSCPALTGAGTASFPRVCLQTGHVHCKWSLCTVRVKALQRVSEEIALGLVSMLIKQLGIFSHSVRFPSINVNECEFIEI